YGTKSISRCDGVDGECHGSRGRESDCG
ncbi:hypothetical protein A2U01_0112131, partial [Trifolium medium]|nr:hypothetical protein [Trifolium medium]